MLQSSQYRRVKERYIWEVIQKVQDWRTLFHEGLVDELGNIQKLSLHEAAEYVGIPKKTLEDYQQLLKKAATKVQLSEIQDKKMGFLRKLIREGRVKNIKGTPGRKSHHQMNQEYESTTHEQIQCQQMQYPPNFMEEQKDQWSQDEQEENFVMLTGYQPQDPTEAYNIEAIPACPEDMIIDGDIQPRSFDQEEDQLNIDQYQQHIMYHNNPFVNIILIQEVRNIDCYNPANPFFDEEIDLFESKDKFIQDSIDMADYDTDSEE